MTGDNNDGSIPEYVKKHDVFGIFDELLQQLIIHQPLDPIDFLVKYLESSHGPKIVVLSRPKIDVSHNLKVLSDSFGTVLIQLRATGTETAVEELRLRIGSKECKEKGWLLHGFPSTKGEALAIQSAGILPDVIVIIDDENWKEEKEKLSRRFNESSITGNSALGEEESKTCYFYRNSEEVSECFRGVVVRFVQNSDEKDYVRQISSKLNHKEE